jgi:hypothetical protein
MDRYSHTTVSVYRPSPRERVVELAMAALVGLPLCTAFALGVWLEAKDWGLLEWLSFLSLLSGVGPL